MISARKLTFAIHEHDFAMRAKSHGDWSRECLGQVVLNLPDPEFQEAKAAIQAALAKAVKRTKSVLTEMGVELDMAQHPMHARSAYQTPISSQEAEKKP